MKTCKKCKAFDLILNICKNRNNLTIIDVLVAQYCKLYKCRYRARIHKVKCCRCGNINHYGWCCIKKRCYTKEETNIEKSCTSYVRPQKPKRW